MTNFNKPTAEDDAFNHVEMMSKIKQELVRSQMQAKTQQEFYDELRNSVIEEVALHIEKLKGFGKDTTDSLAVYIREMKK